MLNWEYGMGNTRDLRDFNFEELHRAGKLLQLVKTDKDHTFRLGTHITAELNPSSGYVFLVDENFNVAMLNGEHLEDWLICPKCKNEGFISTLASSGACCKSYARSEFLEDKAA